MPRVSCRCLGKNPTAWEAPDYKVEHATTTSSLLGAFTLPHSAAGICGAKIAGYGIDAPNTLIRSEFHNVAVNHTTTAGLRAAGWINHFEDLELRANGVQRRLSSG